MSSDQIRWRGAAIACLVALTGGATAQTAVETFTIDFESLPEETEVGDQFAGLGATFSIDGDPVALPIVAREGEPFVAFVGTGADAPMPSGEAGLTDPLVQGDPLVGRDIVIAFDPPVTSVRLFAIDLDGAETVTLRAFDGVSEVDSFTRSAGEVHTGHALATEFFVSAASITSVIVEVPDLIGFAIDHVTCTRTCPAPPCPPQVRIAQESAPGVGDFDDHILGFLPPIPSPFTAADAYAWDLVYEYAFGGQSIDPVADRSHLFLSENADGLTLNIIQDMPGDPDGGAAEMSFELFDDPDGAFRSVEDDPGNLVNGDLFTGEPGDALFTAILAWGACCGDGMALTGLDGDWSMILQFTEVDGRGFTPPIEGLTEWIAYGADGSEIALALEVDRRVRLDLISDAPPPCPEDVNGDGVVNVLDLNAVLIAWGASGGPEDINGDGIVNVLDLNALLVAWGPC